jgi:hypothetical protein
MGFRDEVSKAASKSIVKLPEVDIEAFFNWLMDPFRQGGAGAAEPPRSPDEISQEQTAERMMPEDIRVRKQAREGKLGTSDVGEMRGKADYVFRNVGNKAKRDARAQRLFHTMQTKGEN